MRLVTYLVFAVLLLSRPAVYGDDAQMETEAVARTTGRLLLEAPEGARVWIEREPRGTGRTFTFSYRQPGGTRST